MKKLQLSIIGLLVICIISFFIYKNMNPQISTRPIEAELEHYYLKGQLSQWLANEGMEVRNIKLSYGNDTSQIQLHDIANKPVLIYYINGSMCSGCVQFGIKKIKEYLGELNNNSKVIIITSGMTARERQLLCDNQCYCYDSDSEKLDIPIETASIPFFFILDTNKKVNMFFLPDQTNPIYTEKYLEIVSRRIIQ